MTTLPTPRKWLGMGAALLVGFAVGCSHCCHQCEKSAGACDTKACATCPPATLPRIARTAPECRPIPPPCTLPLTTLPPVSNERYLPPDKPAQIVTADKPKLDESLIKPVDMTVMPRRSFPDITARPEFNHTSDYGCLVGELHYAHQKNQWRLRYASIDEEDRYGGSVMLDGGDHMMKECQNGMLVRVQGSMVDADSREPCPTYRVRSIDPVKK